MTYPVCSVIVALCSPSNNAAAGGSIARADTPTRYSPIDHFPITGHSAGCKPPPRCTAQQRMAAVVQRPCGYGAGCYRPAATHHYSNNLGVVGTMHHTHQPCRPRARRQL